MDGSSLHSCFQVSVLHGWISMHSKLLLWFSVGTIGLPPYYMQHYIVLANRVSGRHLDTKTSKISPQDTQILFVSNFLKCHFKKYTCNYFNELIIHVLGL